MSAESRKERMDSMEVLLQQELHCYRQMYTLALARSRAVQEGEYFSLEDVKPGRTGPELASGMERLQREIQNLDKELDPMRRAWEDRTTRSRDEESALKGLAQEIRQVIGEVLALEEGSSVALSAVHSRLKHEILGLRESNRLAGYALQTNPLPRFLNFSI